MRNACIIDTETAVDIIERVKNGGVVVEICGGVLYRQKFPINPLRNIIEKLFAGRLKYKIENIEAKNLLVKFLMNNF